MPPKKQSHPKTPYDETLFSPATISARYEMEEKFWEVKTKDLHSAVRWGKKDAAHPQSTQKKHDSAEEAEINAAKLAKEKIGKGYKLVHEDGSKPISSVVIPEAKRGRKKSVEEDVKSAPIAAEEEGKRASKRTRGKKETEETEETEETSQTEAMGEKEENGEAAQKKAKVDEAAAAAGGTKPHEEIKQPEGKPVEEVGGQSMSVEETSRPLEASP